MSVFRNVMVYLGLGADEEYDDGYLDDGSNDASSREPRVETPRSVVPSDKRGTTSMSGSFGGVDRPSAVGAVRPLRAVPSVSDDGDEADTEEPLPTRLKAKSDNAKVRAVPMQRTKPRALSPQSFGDAKTLADELRQSVPVIMNLRGLDRDLARRLIDFASGSCYSLGGKMEKLAPQVFLLIPKSVEISDEDRRRIDERGFGSD